VQLTPNHCLWSTFFSWFYHGYDRFSPCHQCTWQRYYPLLLVVWLAQIAHHP